MSITEHPMPLHVRGVPEVTERDDNENNSAKMTDPPLVRARGVSHRRKASPVLSMVRESDEGYFPMPQGSMWAAQAILWRCRRTRRRIPCGNLAP